VKVRLLVDDFDVRTKDDGLSAVDAHPNIEVRMFNPLPSRSGTIAFAADFLDDEYFGASADVNVVDLDLAMVGSVVRDASASFDRYWNPEVVYPIALLSPARVDPQALEQFRGRLAAALPLEGQL